MTELLPLMSYCLVMSGTPGPNNMMLTAAGANFGYRAALPQILGILVGNIVLTLLCCLGLGEVFVAYPRGRQGLQLAGSLYLIVLAWQLCGARLAEIAPTRRPPGFWHGALFQGVNPKCWVKALTIASVFMPAQLTPLWGALLVSLIGAVVGFPAISVWALFGMAIRRWLAHAGVQRAFNLCMGAVLLVLALLFLR